MSVSKPPRWESEREKLSERSKGGKREERRQKQEEKKEVYHSETDWIEFSSSKDKEVNLPPVSQEKGLGDILYNLVPDSDADPVEEIQDVRERI